MGARFRSWWQRVRKSLEIFVVIVGCMLVIALLVVIALVYIFNVNVPGLRGKTLWDWLQLLIIPLVLAVVALLFNFANSRAEQKIATQRYEQDQQIALDKQRQDLLQAYLDRMSELLLKEQLRSSEDDAEVRNVARVRTITVLTQLDARRVGYVFAFLREARLLSSFANEKVVSLGRADLHAVNWSQADLSYADLSYADLNNANFTAANLNNANFTAANLNNANFTAANLSQADLSGADLSGADLSGADLSYAILHHANLNGADLSGADLRSANLISVNFSSANLIGVNLSGASYFSIEDLNNAKSLQGATMPNGTIHP